MIASVGDQKRNLMFNYANLFCALPLFHYFCLLMFMHQ